MSVATPLAAATTPVINTDLVVRFGDIVEGSTRDITFAVVDLIDRTIRQLGPQEPNAPELILPPQPQQPSVPIWQDPAAWAQYAADYAAWGLEVAELNAGHAVAYAEYLQAMATYLAWDLAVSAFIARLRDVAIDTEGLFFASATYPRTVSVVNNGPNALLAGSVVTVQVASDINLVNGSFPGVGPVQVIQTGGTTLLTYVVPSVVPAGGQVFSQGLEYNPVAVTLNITDTVQQSSITAALAPASQDVDVNDNGDLITSPLGVRLDVATGDVQAIIGEWQDFLQSAIDFYELVEPFLPEIDWLDVIGGLLPLPAP